MNKLMFIFVGKCPCLEFLISRACIYSFAVEKKFLPFVFRESQHTQKKTVENSIIYSLFVQKLDWVSSAAVIHLESGIVHIVVFSFRRQLSKPKCG